MGFTLVEIILLCLFLFISWTAQRPHLENGQEDARQELVHHLGLTDFAIWTEARYTRHPSQTDFFSPFQEFPASFEHFPAGSVVAPVLAPGGGQQ